MSSAALASEAFVPFGPGTLASSRASGGAANLKVMPKDSASQAFSPLQTSPGSHQHGAGGSASGQPTLTLQREGDKITGIRVECACGQVIELACSY